MGAEDEEALNPDCLLGVKDVEGDIAPESVWMGARSSHLAVSNGRIACIATKIDSASARMNKCFALLGFARPGEVFVPPYARDCH